MQCGIMFVMCSGFLLFIYTFGSDDAEKNWNDLKVDYDYLIDCSIIVTIIVMANILSSLLVHFVYETGI